MPLAKPAATMLILAGVMLWGAPALAQTPNQAPAATPQPASPAAPQPSTPQPQPSTAPPAAPGVPTTAQQQPQAADPVGSVATLQGSAFVTHNNAAGPLKLSQSIYKGDVLQTGTDGTMGITFD